MTVRNLIQELLLNSPDLDSEVYVQRFDKNNDDIYYDYVIDKIDNYGSKDSIFIEIKHWKSE